tara:strand:+ start:6349 stop:6495 length:147 start_codon:yes stop_codon:yes gene_type:complete
MHPGLKVLDDRSDTFLPYSQALRGCLAVDLPLNVEDRIDALQSFESQW